MASLVLACWRAHLVKSSALPAPFERSELAAAGFTGWRTWAELRSNELTGVAEAPVAYIVYRSGTDAPAFLARSPAGHFKGRDPTVATEALRASWVEGSHVVYIGKADIARRRLKQYARF